MTRLLSLLLLSLLITGSPAQISKAPVATVASARRSLTKAHVVEKIRIYYTTEGEHAVISEDINGNGIPDQVEDIMTQTVAALQLWTNLGFADPFTTKRYLGTSWLDIHLISKDVLKSNGVTYDEIQSFKRAGDPEGTGSLCFNVATSVKAPANLTPAHEVFHILQNSVCYFKNRWFTEGTARWSERALGQGGLPTGLVPALWPPNEATMPSIFTAAYDTATTYWAPLLAQRDKVGKLPKEKLPASLLDARYVNGEPVLKDLDLTGWELIHDVLHALDEADEGVYQQRQLTRWSEKDQFSPENDATIHRIVREEAARRR
ncbi:MAG: hypothetical protein V4662_12730 [Verrucomicrobiota bacterium]